MVFALAGNQNCGKTTLFNQLTGSNQNVGNFPGVTVEQKIGSILGHKDDSVVDLPGIYSLSPYTSEEIVTRDFLLRQKPDGIINIVDATKPLRKIGLSGRSFVPMLMGFGCTVPAIMATRTLASERDRKMTILLTPFMSCTAKVPIYATFTYAFFPRYQALVMMGLYLSGILLGVLSGLLMKKTAYRGAPVPFVMELPNYRFPSAKTVLLLLWDKARDFIRRAFTVIFLASVAIWFLQSFDFRVNPVADSADSADSILAAIGRGISGIFVPLGFSDWRVPTALITGFTAKEAVISTLAVLTGTGVAELGGTLHTLFTPLAVLSFLVFTLLYTPCVAAVATVRREWGSLKGTVFVVLYQTGVAWLMAFLVYQVGRLAGFSS